MSPMNMGCGVHILSMAQHFLVFMYTGLAKTLGIGHEVIKEASLRLLYLYQILYHGIFA